MVAVGIGQMHEPQSETTSKTQDQARRWKLVGTYPTYELAEASCRALRERGIPCAVSMIGGLSVIAFN